MEIPTNLALLDEPLGSPSISRKMISAETDVLVIGGGAAGNFAALAAREQRAEVMLVEKAWNRRAGCIGAGLDHWQFFLNEGADWDTPEAFTRWMVETVGPCDYNVVSKAVTGKLPEVKSRIEELGVHFVKDKETGKYERTQSFGQPGPWWLMSDNSLVLLPKLAARVRQVGIKVVDWVMVVELLTDKDGRIAGAVGFNIRQGEPHCIRAKTVVLATGAANRMTTNSSSNLFNTWISPFSTGSGQAMALQSGARLADIELGRATLIPRGLGTPGVNAIAGMGGYLVNRKGERFMSKYHRMMEKAPRGILVAAVMKEIESGDGPVYFDVRHLSQEDRDFLLNNLFLVDKPVLGDYMRQKGVDLAKDLVELEVGELMPNAGILVDEECKTNVPGLYAGGACTTACPTGVAQASVCIAQGLTAGENAGRASKGATLPEVQSGSVDAAVRRMYGPLDGGTISASELNAKIADSCSVLRSFPTEETLQKALRELDELQSLPLRADNLHELMRAQEVKHLMIVARAMMFASIRRRESRQYHHRGDYPGKDPAMDSAHLVVEYLKTGELRQSIMPRDLGPFARS